MQSISAAEWPLSISRRNEYRPEVGRRKSKGTGKPEKPLILARASWASFDASNRYSLIVVTPAPLVRRIIAGCIQRGGWAMAINMFEGARRIAIAKLIAVFWQ